ncbi:formylglycine-generating enzyme family protein [Solimicrobium silvestre]|uniref:Sulfatase-modifying factor enzyme-like domain-containing protein n=1 Tax=Solimicrobium silvestre TaxID=2099400 RepID=A0A2S9GTY6_9BURK|nr:formylglycine-generating enzyme family protein [Solimicrobium silvestre]PRC91169.1 hypothetical protein S2091_4170 [Solimicrobium silvestre]
MKLIVSVIALLLLGVAGFLGYRALMWQLSTTPVDLHAGTVFRDCRICPEMVVIPQTDRFMMGQSDTGRKDPVEGFMFGEDTTRAPEHPVRIAQFALGRMEITQRQWESLMDSDPSMEKKCGLDCPVEHVSWLDVQEFLRRFNAKIGQHYRLPSEAEWEYAATAGQAPSDATLQEQIGDDASWNQYNSQFTTHPVGSKKANGFQVHDMIGNVWEWVEDCDHRDYNGAPANGRAWIDDPSLPKQCRSGYRVVRGGSCISPTRTPRDRGAAPEDRHGADLGFRVARDLP